MFEKLIIKNFQSHKQTKLIFKNGINIIIGKSDSGKTAILRALNWIINNKPQGNEYRSNFGGDTIVKLNINDDIIIREKSKNKNSYYLNNIEFTAFNNNVPDEIAKIINFSELNMQYQLDLPFLLLNSAGENARFFNRIIKLDKIDSSLQNIEKLKRETNKKILYLQQEIEKKEKELQEFALLEKQEKLLKIIEECLYTEKQYRKKYANLRILITQLNTIQQKIKNFSYLYKKEQIITDCLFLYEKLKKIKKNKKKLTNLVQTVYNINKHVSKSLLFYNTKMNVYNKIVQSKCPLCGK